MLTLGLARNVSYNKQKYLKLFKDHGGVNNFNCQPKEKKKGFKKTTTYS